MKYCPECASAVAENDIFCPYCGISLNPIPVAGDLAAEQFESTIVMSPPAAKPTAEPAVKPAEPISSIKPVETHTIAEPLEKEPVVVPANEAVAEVPKAETPVAITAEPLQPPAAEGVKAAAEPVVEAEQPAIEEPAVEAVATPEAAKAEDVFHTEPVKPVEEEEPAVIETVAETPTPEPVSAEEPPLPFEIAVSGEVEENIPPIEEVKAAEPAPEEKTPEAEPAPGAESEHVSAPSDVVIEEFQLEPLDVSPSGQVISGPEVHEEAVAAKSDEEHAAEPETVEESLAAEVEEAPMPELLAEPAVHDHVKGTDSGQIVSDGGTTPNIGGPDTDGRRTGLKPLSEGTLLNGRYRIVKKIGGGGMGAVYLATDQNLGGTHRAVKEMVQSHIEEEQQAKAIEDFKRESMILSSLDHPAIPTIYDYFYDEVESRFYLVMKYIAGGDLASRLRSTPEGRIDERTVTEWALQIIDVLDYLHSLPTTIVYRDLKPSNVMIDGNTGRIMLIDFGIARSINQNQEKGVTAVGTMGYAPPELFSGQVEPRSDIYSLGSTMFHLLTGADPQNNPLLIFDFQKNPRPRQINPRLSDQMERILMRSVEYSADARFPTAADMRRALQEHLDNLRTGNVTYGISEIPAAVSLANQSVFCGFCGQRIVATDLFCAFCGSKQPIAQQGVHSEIYGRGGITARLIIDGTSELEAPVFSLDKSDNLVGRRDPMSNIFPEVDLSKYDPQTKISRRHARIWRDGLAFMVEDLGSSNGTLLVTAVNDTLRLVPHMPHLITNGDRLRIGDTTLHFIVG